MWIKAKAGVDEPEGTAWVSTSGLVLSAERVVRVKPDVQMMVEEYEVRIWSLHAAGEGWTWVLQGIYPTREAAMAVMRTLVESMTF